ncbi:MAG: hypothetical protein ABR543_00170 [Gemmatimonadaceae bacterium]
MSLHPEDKKAGFTGLIVAVVVLTLAVYGVVLLTNRKFESHAEAAATH